MQSDGESQALDVSVLMRVLNGGRPERRWQLARDLAELWCDAQADPAERVAVEPLLLQLAYDPVRKVRAELARALAPAQTLSDEIFFGIVADEPGIALVFLAESRALHPARMRVVMELGDDARRAVVLGRPDVSAEIIAPVLASAKAELVVPLLSNVSWHIEPEAAKALYRRLGHEADVAELLLAREELPAVVRALHVHLLRQRFAADLASRPFMAENRARLMLVESEEVALTAIAAEARAEEMNELAQFFVRHGPFDFRLAGAPGRARLHRIPAPCLGGDRVRQA